SDATVPETTASGEATPSGAPQPVEAPSTPSEAPAGPPASDTDESDAPAGPQVPTNLPLGFPAWLAAEEPTPAAQRALETFQAEFLPGVPVSESILPSIKSRFFYVAEPAAQTLSLIENVEGMC